MHACSSLAVMSDSLRPFGLQPIRLLHPWNFPDKNTGVGCHVLLQGIFPTQGSKLSLLCLLHCRQILYPLNPLGSPLWVYCSLNPTRLMETLCVYGGRGLSMYVQTLVRDLQDSKVIQGGLGFLLPSPSLRHLKRHLCHLHTWCQPSGSGDRGRVWGVPRSGCRCSPSEQHFPLLSTVLPPHSVLLSNSASPALLGGDGWLSSQLLQLASDLRSNFSSNRISATPLVFHHHCLTQKACNNSSFG